MYTVFFEREKSSTPRFQGHWILQWPFYVVSYAFLTHNKQQAADTTNAVAPGIFPLLPPDSYIKTQGDIAPLQFQIVSSQEDGIKGKKLNSA